MLPTALSGLLLGLLSSLHCVGMCGPLLLALPIQQLNPAQRTLAQALYHSGRILVYATLGLLFGLLGRHIYLAGWQQSLSISLGILILLIFVGRRMPVLPAIHFSFLLGRWFRRLWQAPSTAALFLLGIANGLLPCGMVYLAIAAALTRTTIIGSISFMLAFGLGTLPLLAGAQYLGRALTSSLRFRLRRLLPVITIAMALLLILRGLNLGIPFVSPKLAAAPQHAVSCH